MQLETQWTHSASARTDSTSTKIATALAGIAGSIACLVVGQQSYFGLERSDWIDVVVVAAVAELDSPELVEAVVP